jgi:hypothetical protein
VKDEQPKVTGYRNLNEEEIITINDVKAFAEECGDLIATLKQNPEFDQRWISIGATDLQKGFMAIIRGIARPTTF